MAEYSMTDEIKSSVELIEGTVLPRARVAPCSDRLPPTVEMQPLPASIAHEDVEEKSPAQWAYERLILYIKNFEDRLDNKHEVAMGLVGGEAGVLAHRRDRLFRARHRHLLWPRRRRLAHAAYPACRTAERRAARDPQSPRNRRATPHRLSSGIRDERGCRAERPRPRHPPRPNPPKLLSQKPSKAAAK